jgi:integral membrane sensor domain MASE1
VPDRVVVTRALPTWVPTAAAAAAVLVVGFALWPRLASLGDLRPAREVPVAEPRLMAVATAPAAPAEPALSVTTVSDTLFDHADDVEFILDPVVLHRGRAQTASSLPDGVQGEQTVISF